MGSADRRSKVARLVDEYGLDGLEGELEARWTGEVEPRLSLRDLADRFNLELLRTALLKAGLNPMDQDVDGYYEALTSPDVSEGQRAQVRNELARAGVDVASLEADFVSHQSMHTYLTEVRGAEAPTAAAADAVENDVETLQRLLSRTTAVTEGTLERHSDAGRIALGEFDVLLDLRVLCNDCGTDRDALTLLREGGCDCADPDDAAGE